MELRCPSGILLGTLDLELGIVEMKCRSNRCGHHSGAIVLHCYSIKTGTLVETKKFTDPIKEEMKCR